MPVTPHAEGEDASNPSEGNAINDSGPLHEPPAVQTAPTNSKRGPRNGNSSSPENRKNRAAKRAAENA